MEDMVANAPGKRRQHFNDRPLAVRVRFQADDLAYAEFSFHRRILLGFGHRLRRIKRVMLD